MVFGNGAGQHLAFTCPVSRRHRGPEGSLVRVTTPLWPPVVIVTVVITWQRDQSALATHLFLHRKMARIGHAIIVSLRITRRMSFFFFLLKIPKSSLCEDQPACPYWQLSSPAARWLIWWHLVTRGTSQTAPATQVKGPDSVCPTGPGGHGDLSTHCCPASWHCFLPKSL